MFVVIGISDNENQYLEPKVLDIIHEAKIFSGGKRHHELMRHLLPKDYLWIDITVPIQRVIQEYEKFKEDIVVFASGDPLFYGFANTLKRLLPQAQLVVYPYFNSLQLLAHRMLLTYQDMRCVSLTGRPWNAFDEALIKGEKLIGSLTDQKKTPAMIGQRMLDYGYDNYIITVGECLGNSQKEQVTTLSLSEASKQIFSFPNCVILQQTSTRKQYFGIPEDEFHLLNGRTRMITKMPIRLLTLSMLQLHGKQSFWDVGSCTGSISIEAKLQFPHLNVTAFEIRQEGEELLQKNAMKFGAPGIDFHAGDFLDIDTSTIPLPDAVFIGGHGGKLKEMVMKIKKNLKPNGCIVFNSVSVDSLQMFREAVCEAGMRITSHTHIAINSHNPIEILKAE